MKAHDHAAFEEFAQLYEARLYDLHCWLTGDLSLAEDLTQETFLAVWRGLDGFRGEAKLFTWICQIARNIALQKRRKHELTTVSLDEATNEVTAEEVSEAAARTMLRDKVRASLAELPQEQREALVLNKFGDLSHAEIARVLNKPLGTVKWHIAQGLQGLRSKLQEKGVTSSEV
jgi:RNA polymerase sigma-70 factor (ECF subfamily)